MKTKLILFTVCLMTLVTKGFTQSQTNTFPTTGSAGVGTTSPISLFSVGASSQFQVNSSGAIVSATGITTSGQIFQNTSAGGQGLVFWDSNYGGMSQITAPVNAGYLRQIIIDQPNMRLLMVNGNADGGAGGGISRDAGAITNIFSNYSSAGGVALSTSGANRLFVNTGGNIGIGTTTPLGKLDVNFTDNATKDIFIFGNSANNTYSPVGGLRFAWYGNNFADIQMVSQGSNNDGLGLSFHTSTSNNSNTVERMRITPVGNVLIGRTTQKNSSYLLDVNGAVRSNSVTVNVSGADFVFDQSYRLPSLTVVENYVNINHHLPGIPTAKQMQSDGLNLGDNQIKLLQKVEELTLYLIHKEEQEKLDQQELISQKQLIDCQKKAQAKQQKEIQMLKQQLKKLTQKIDSKHI